MSGPQLTVLLWEVWGTLKGVTSLKDVASRGEDCIYPLPYSVSGPLREEGAALLHRDDLPKQP